MTRLEYLLTKLSEECHELGKVACKASRFGLQDINPNKKETNENLLYDELLDVCIIFQTLINEGYVVDQTTLIENKKLLEQKKEKLEYWYNVSKEKGIIKE